MINIYLRFYLRFLSAQTKGISRRFLTEQVAFTAIKVAGQANLGINQNIVFENVILNEGEAYHAKHDICIALATGMYIFTTTLLRSPQSTYFHGQQVHNGAVVTKLHGSNLDVWNQGSQSVFLKVNAGEEVRVRNAGPSCSKLTMSLVNDSLKFTSSDTQIC